MKKELKRKIRWWLKNMREKGRRINEFKFDDELPIHVRRREGGDDARN